MSGALSQKIQEEIRRLEKRQAEIEAQLRMPQPPVQQTTLRQHLSSLDRTLIALRQQQNRMTG